MRRSSVAALALVLTAAAPASGQIQLQTHAQTNSYAFSIEDLAPWGPSARTGRFSVSGSGSEPGVPR